MSERVTQRKAIHLFRTCEGRWAEYRGWLWNALPPEDRKVVFSRRAALAAAGGGK